VPREDDGAPFLFAPMIIARSSAASFTENSKARSQMIDRAMLEAIHKRHHRVPHSKSPVFGQLFRNIETTADSES